MIRLARSFSRQTPARRQAAREAIVALLRAWMQVRRQDFARYAPELGSARNGEPDWDWDGDRRAVRDVKWAIERWNRLAGGRFTCLMVAMAGQVLLARRGIDSAVVLGVKPGAAGEEAAAHAWLRVGSWLVLGGEERDGYLPVASYRRSWDDSTPTGGMERSGNNSPRAI